MAFDLLALAERDLRETPFFSRRSELEGVMAAVEPPIHLTPLTGDPAVARDWFKRFEGAGLDGVVAKPSSVRYLAGQRAMLKVKHERTGDFVVAGFRWYQANPEVVGSLMLGLYDGDQLQHVGVIGAFPAAQRRAAGRRASALPQPGDHPWAGLGGAGHRNGQRRPAAPGRGAAGGTPART